MLTEFTCAQCGTRSKAVHSHGADVDTVYAIMDFEHSIDVARAISLGRLQAPCVFSRYRIAVDRVLDDTGAQIWPHQYGGEKNTGCVTAHE